jgi:hypothetical protein
LDPKRLDLKSLESQVFSEDGWSAAIPVASPRAAKRRMRHLAK